MPLSYIKKIDSGFIGVWKIGESLDELLRLADLTFKDEEKLSKITNIQRKREWLASRVLLDRVLGMKVVIGYKSNGSPFLQNASFNISISHSADFAAIVLHKKYIPGLDIERVTRPVGNIASRFMSQYELASYELDEKKQDVNKLLIYWCAKEAVFKMLHRLEVNFSEQIEVLPFKVEGNNGSLRAFYKRGNSRYEVELHYSFVEDNIMVWGVRCF